MLAQLLTQRRGAGRDGAVALSHFQGSNGIMMDLRDFVQSLPGSEARPRKKELDDTDEIVTVLPGVGIDLTKDPKGVGR